MQFITEKYARESGIIYCMSRKKVDEVAAWLSTKGLSRVLPYHAGLPAEVRKANQDRFINEEGVVVVATIAFGMGIDKPNVRYVVHMDLPKSVEAYYQETGRAGRDGLPSTAWLLYSLSDIVALKQMMQTSDADEAHKLLEHRKLDALLGICETTECRRRVLLRYFGETRTDPCMNCDNCLEPPATYDGTIEAQKVLSAVFRTGQRFGAAYVSSILRGEVDERAQRFGHDKLSVFGVGQDHDQRTWMSIVRQLVSLGYLTVDMSGFGGLSLAARSKELLKGKAKVFLRHDVLRKRAKVTKRSVAAAEQYQPGEGDLALFEKLRARRLALAREANVPPYVVFHDSTLKEMVVRRPTTLDDLRTVTGVGESKAARYGEQFLEVIRNDGADISGTSVL